MSSLTKSLLRATSTSFRFAARIPPTSTSHRAALLHVSAPRASLNESDLSRHDGDRRDEIETHRNDQQNKHNEGRGEWKGELGSSSENAVKADRGETEHGDKDIEQLQKETAKKANEEARAK